MHLCQEDRPTSLQMLSRVTSYLHKEYMALAEATQTKNYIHMTIISWVDVSEQYNPTSMTTNQIASLRAL